jgi:hypothetical protein
MRELTPETITDAVLDQMATTPDPRLETIMASAVKHLHAFAREVNLTPAEWIKGMPSIRFDMRLARESEADKTSGRVGADPSAIMKRPAKSELAPLGASV